MQLHYLDFDFSDEESGRGSFDAMACVTSARLPAVRQEVAEVLAWTSAAFGPAGALEDEGEWDYALQEVVEPDARTTLTLTLGGSPAFCDAFRDAFSAAE
jgi:hypothetical protein